MLRRAFPGWTTSTEAIGCAAIALSRPGNTETAIATIRDINQPAGMGAGADMCWNVAGMACG